MSTFSPRQALAISLSIFIFLSLILNVFTLTGTKVRAEEELLPLPDLSNVAMRLQGMELSDELRAQLAQDLFVVLPGWGSFSNVYEIGAYGQKPLFVTVDAMLHLQHLLFAHLLNSSEDHYLADELQTLSEGLLKVMQEQLKELKGSDFEQAAIVDLTFVAVANALLDENFQLPEEVRETAEKELALIREADGIALTPLFMQFSQDKIYEDYSQYKPRGYYTRSPRMEAYFRAMMWYGRINFSNKDELRNRCGLLLSLALANDEACHASWDKLYEVSALFAGESDDLSYRDFQPLIEKIYGTGMTAAKLPEMAEVWPDFHQASMKMPGPRIYSEARKEKSDEEEAAEAVGFRLMGQRFSADQEIFGQLIYNAVKANSQGEVRGLPDVLDVMAAMGSEKALELLKEEGAEDFENYPENMKELRQRYADPEKSPAASNLAAAWLDSLRPLLSDKTTSKSKLPAFMRSEKWARKDLECFAGSFTELKHDNVLYAKQVMAEMGGAFEEKVDDRGYVQPEPLIFRKLAELARSSGQKLSDFAMLNENDAKLIEDVALLNERLATIAEKELKQELPDEEEFNLIRAFGGNLENLTNLLTQQSEEDMPDGDKPEIAVDVATDPNAGEVLELALGQPDELWVIVPVDGSLRLAFGAVYNFYQFRQPQNERLTDEEWRSRIGAEPQFDEEGKWLEPDPALIPEKPSWTQDYRQDRSQLSYKEEASTHGEERLPAWAELGRGVCSSADGQMSATFGGGRATLSSAEGKSLWNIPRSWLVQDLQFLDIDHNGQEDLLLLCWKEGRYGSYRPFG